MEISVVTEHIMEEINTLIDQQNTAIRNAALIGMTEREEAEYNGRVDKIARLVKQLTLLHAPRA